jgi:hypothetical protein
VVVAVGTDVATTLGTKKLAAVSATSSIVRSREMFPAERQTASATSRQ